MSNSQVQNYSLYLWIQGHCQTGELCFGNTISEKWCRKGYMCSSFWQYGYPREGIYRFSIGGEWLSFGILFIWTSLLSICSFRHWFGAEALRLTKIMQLCIQQYNVPVCLPCLDCLYKYGTRSGATYNDMIIWKSFPSKDDILRKHDWIAIITCIRMWSFFVPKAPSHCRLTWCSQRKQCQLLNL